MSWVYIFFAGLLEVAWAYGLKVSDGFTRPIPSATTVLLMIASFVLLAQGMKQLPIGTAYVVWTGIGAIGTVIVGIIFLGEPRDLARLLCMGLMAAGVIGLRLITPSGS